MKLNQYHITLEPPQLNLFLCWKDISNREAAVHILFRLVDQSHYIVIQRTSDTLYEPMKDRYSKIHSHHSKIDYLFWRSLSSAAPNKKVHLLVVVRKITDMQNLFGVEQASRDKRTRSVGYTNVKHSVIESNDCCRLSTAKQ